VTQLSISLINAVDFYSVFCEFLAGRVHGEQILDHIVNGVRVVKFSSQVSQAS